MRERAYLLIVDPPEAHAIVFNGLQDDIVERVHVVSGRDVERNFLLRRRVNAVGSSHLGVTLFEPLNACGIVQIDRDMNAFVAKMLQNERRIGNQNAIPSVASPCCGKILRPRRR